MQHDDQDTSRQLDQQHRSAGIIRATCRPGVAMRTYAGECKTKAPDHEARLAAIAARVEREEAEEAKKKR